MGTQGGDIDFALLVDGLAAEREQGITIDVAYRFFSTDRRKFIVADTPGHEQYTRNMATGASTADLAVILVDARKGVLQQTRRHSYIVSLLGIKHVVLAVNKMDAVGYGHEVFEAIVAEYREFAASLGFEDIVAIPMSALRGDNVTAPSQQTPWYYGPTLMQHLESVEIEEDLQQRPFRMAVQWVNRPDQDFRGFAGTIASGVVRVGDGVRALPSGRQSRVARIVTMDGDLEQAVAGQAVTLTLEDEIDVSRGDVLAQAGSPPGVADQFQVTMVWMHEEHMLPGRPYLMKIGPRMLNASVTDLRHRVNVNTLEHVAARQLELNEIGVCNLSTDRPIAFDAYEDNRETGAFIFIDKLTNDTVGAGMIHFALRRSDNVHWQALDVDKEVAGRPEGPAVLRTVVHRPVGRRQVHDREPGREEAAGHGPAYLHPRRRQRAPRPQQGPGLHRCRSRREHPPRGRSIEADGGRGPDRAGLVHLALPVGAPPGPGAARGRRVHRGVRGHAAGRGREARPEGPVPQGPGREDQELHRHRFALRAAGARGADDRYELP